MIEEINRALETYHKKWHELVAKRQNQVFFKELKPVAVGWKVADQTEYGKLYATLREHCDKIIEVWMNGRWIAKMHLRDNALAGGVPIIKLMQRRPASTDATGLDHVDFYSPHFADAEKILRQETNLKWTHEDNDAVKGYEWISLWFDGAEAKLKAGTVLNIVVSELQDINQQILKHK